MNLTGMHLVCVDPEIACQMELIIRLQDQGCTVHLAKNRTEALGFYWRLYTQDLVPRALITEWYLAHPGSREQKLYETVGRPQFGTAFDLIARVRQLDPSVAIIVATHDVRVVPEGLGVQVVNKVDHRAVIAALERTVQRQNYHHRHSEVVAL